jgi:hypothetical protein
MDDRGGEVNERLSGYAGVEPKIGDVLEFGVTALDAELPLLVRAVVRKRTKGGFGIQFLAETADERRDLSLFRQVVRAAAGYTDA